MVGSLVPRTNQLFLASQAMGTCQASPRLEVQGKKVKA